MGDTGVVRFQGNLDPRAQEFRPQLKNPMNNDHHHQIPLFAAPPPPPPQVYYPYTPFPPQNDVQVLPFCCPSPFPPPHQPYVDTTTPVVISHQSPVPPPSAASTRTLVLSSVACDVSESTVRRELEVFGEVRGVQMERVLDGIVTVHFYDLRHAERALKEIREQHMQQQSRLRNLYSASASLVMMMPHHQHQQLQNSCGVVCNVGESCLLGNPQQMSLLQSQPPPGARGLIAGRVAWAHFIIPASNAVPDGCNQGTIVIFNLDSGVSSSTLKGIFGAFGDVKELRETPLKKRQRFVEFYDTRDAAKALKEMNGKEINGKQVVIEFSRPGGYGRKFYNASANAMTATTINTCASLPPLISPASFHQSSSEFPPPPPPPPPPMRKFSGCRRSPSKIFPRSLPSHNQPSVKKSLSFNGGKNHNGSLEMALDSLSLSDSVGTGIEEKIVNGVSKNGANKCSSGSSSSSQTVKSMKQQQTRSRPWKGRQTKKLDTRFLINEDAMVESSCGSDTRTTVMIKNIPNKYSQKLLLNMLDNHCIHCNEQIGGGDDQPLSSYDFVYLPIDFNNKCNVGYGFVNMTSPQAAWRLYKAFHHQHWEVFNSRKICEVTYARVQGLGALKEHFKNSKFPCEMDHYLPVVFSPPRDGKQQLTEPQPIVGHYKSINVGLHGTGPKIAPELEDDDYDVEGVEKLENNGNGTICDSEIADQNLEDDPIGGSSSCISSQCSSSSNGGDICDGDDRDSGCGSVVA